MATKVVLVTGATGGIGGAVVRVVLERGWQIAVTYRQEQKLAQLLKHSGVSHNDLLAVQADATDEKALAGLKAEISTRFDRLDGLVNLVGGFRGGQTIAETDARDWDFMMTLNLKSVFLVCKHIIPVVAKTGPGSVVNISSKAALAGMAKSGAYAVSKAGVITLTKTLAAEFKSDGVRINAVLPSIVETEANLRAMPGADRSNWVTPDELAKVCAFLISDDAAAVTGQAIGAFGKIL